MGNPELAGRHANTDALEKIFTLPSGATSLSIEFDFLEIDSWDSEVFTVSVDGAAVFQQTFVTGPNDESNHPDSTVILLPGGRYGVMGQAQFDYDQLPRYDLTVDVTGK